MGEERHGLGRCVLKGGKEEQSDPMKTEAGLSNPERGV